MRLSTQGRELDAVSDLADLWRQEWDKEYQSTLNETRMPEDQWRTAGRATKEKPNGEDLDWWQTDGLRQLEGYVKWLDQNPTWRVLAFPNGDLAAEWGATVTLGNVPVKFFIDAIYVDTSTGELIIVDYKTGSRKPESSMQLGLYATLVEKVHGIRPQLGGYFMTRKGELAAPDILDRWTEAFFKRFFADVQFGINENLYLPSVSSMCSGCSVNRYCAAYGGDLAAGIDPYTGAVPERDRSLHRSFSQATTYAKCGRQFYLQRVARVPEPPAVYLIAGKALHAAIEIVNKTRFTTAKETGL